MQLAADNAAGHLHRECQWLDLLLQRQVLRLRTLRDQAADKFRGLYIADAEVDTLLADADDAAAQTIAALEQQIMVLEEENDRYLDDSPNLPLAQLRTRFDLSQLEC